MIDAGLLLARVMLAVVFVWSGLDKSIHWSAGGGEIQSQGLPFAPVLLLMTVIAQLAGGISVALGVWARRL